MLKVTAMKLAVYLFAAVLPLLFIEHSCAAVSKCERFDSACQDREKVESVMRKHGVEYQEAEAALILATHDLAIDYCSLEVTEEYRKKREELLLNGNISRLRDEMFRYMDSITVYSMENWCADYSRINTIFMPFLYD